MRMMFGLTFLAAQLFAAQNSRIAIRSLGQFDTDNTVLYSVYIATQNEKLGELLISSAMPFSSRYLESVDAPTSARYEGVADNVIQWSVANLAPDTVLGPFTFRVRVDPARTDIPVSLPVSVSYQSPASEILSDAGDPKRLRPLASFGSITVGSKGTDGLVSIGETGILLYVPEGSIDRQVTLSFRRHTIDDSKLPKSVDDIWWCGLYELTIEPNVTFKSAFYALPTRRPLPPGITVRNFASADLQDWKETGTASKSELRAAGFGGFGCLGFQGTIGCGFGFNQGFGSGGLGFNQGFGGQFGGFGFNQGFGNQFGGFGGFGVSQTQRQIGSVTGSQLSQQFSTTVNATQITDGTSNTIIAILIGLR